MRAGHELTRRGVHLAALAILLAPSLASAGEKKKGGGLSYMQFAPLEATVPHGAGRRGVLSVEGGLDVADVGLHRRADQCQPILRDAYLRWLTIYAAALPPGTAPNPDEIADQLQRATDRVLGRPGARFLIGTVMVN